MDEGLFPVSINNTINLNYNMQVQHPCAYVQRHKAKMNLQCKRKTNKYYLISHLHFLRIRVNQKHLPFLFKSPFYHLLYLILLQEEQSVLC